jgi:hypothetical protein
MMEGNPERVNVLVVEGKRNVVEIGERVEVVVEDEIERRAELDALSKGALGFAEFQQTRGKTDDRLTRGCIEKAGSSPGPASLMRGSYVPH